VLLNEIEAKKLLQEAGISVTETSLAISKEEAVALSKNIGFPVVLKIVSPDVVHKSDAGGVIIGLITVKQVEQAYDEILSNVSRKVPGLIYWV
jgi:acyl-CoA synthetase (NDP forming)